MRKFQSFFNDLTTIRSHLRGRKVKQAKSGIGASTNNNRTLTVTQTAKYLERSTLPRMAHQLRVVADLLKKDIYKARNKRTDAIDLNEVVTVYRKQVMENKKYRRQIGSILKD